jgi:hypothetical protein
MKFRAMPLSVVLDLHFYSPIKLNITRDHKTYLIEGEDLALPEYHRLRFEGLVAEYTNSINDIVKMRNKFKK